MIFRKRLYASALLFSILSMNMSSEAYMANVERVFGKDRYQTSIEALKYWNKSDKVILTTGKTYIDALCSSSISYFSDAPIVLVNNSINSEYFDEFKRLGVKNVLIVGGENSVPKSIDDTLKRQYKIERISGNDRYETSEKIADYCIKNFDVRSMYITSANRFEDPLLASSLVAKNNGIILLEKKGNENGTIKEYSKRVDTYIVGGESSVSKSIQDETKAKRISGSNKFETAKKVADMLGKKEGVLVASSRKPTDVLVAGGLSTKLGMPILFAEDKTISREISDGSKVILIGGRNSIPETAESSLAKGESIDFDIKEDKNTKDRDKNIEVNNNSSSGTHTIYVPKNTDNDEINIPDAKLREVLNYWISKESPNADGSKRSADSKITRGEMKKLKVVDVDEKGENGYVYDYNPDEDSITHSKEIIEMKKDTGYVSKKLQTQRFTRGISSLEGLQYATNLEYLDLSENDIKDLSPISGLVKLKRLELDRNLIRDLSPISGLKNMIHLNLYANYISDISPLKNMTKLDFLDVHNNVEDDTTGGIKDISAVKNMSNLIKLDISANGVESVEPISVLKKLEVLDVSANNIKDLMPIRDIVSPIIKDMLNETNEDRSASVQAQTRDLEVHVKRGEKSVSIKNPFEDTDEITKKIVTLMNKNTQQTYIYGGSDDGENINIYPDYEMPGNLIININGGAKETTEFKKILISTSALGGFYLNLKLVVD